MDGIKWWDELRERERAGLAQRTSGVGELKPEQLAIVKQAQLWLALPIQERLARLLAVDSFVRKGSGPPAPETAFAAWVHGRVTPWMLPKVEHHRIES